MVLKVGDRVSFIIKGIQYMDTVVYVNGNIVEGEKYDLSYQAIVGLQLIK